MSQNAARGEASVVIGGRLHRLCLTLGALAEIETALGATSVAALESRLQRPDAKALAAILAALLRGGGEAFTDAEVMALPLDLRAVGEAITRAFAAAGLAGEQPGPNPPQPPGNAFPGGTG